MPLHSYAPCTFVYTLGVYTPPYVSILLCGSVCSHGLLHVVWGCKESLTYWTPPLHLSLYGGATHVYTPTHSLTSLCISMFWWCLHMIWGIFPLYWGFGGIPPILGVWGISTWGVHMPIPVHSCSFLCLTFLLWLQLLLLQLQWCLLGCHWFHQWPWLLPWWGFLEHWISVKWFSHHPWCCEVLEVLLALSLCQSSNLHLQCLFWLMPIMLWVLHR